MNFAPINQLSVPFINGLVPAYASATTLTISAGSCWEVDPTTGVYTYQVTVPTTLTINAAVNGVNGLDTGSLAAHTFYGIYVIGDAQGFNKPAAILSASLTTPTMPQGITIGTTYNIYRLVGYALTDGSSNFLKFWISGNGSGRMHWWDTAISVLSGGNATSYTAVPLYTASSALNAVPLIDSTPILFQTSFTPGAASRTANIIPGNSTATTTSALITGQVTSVVISPQVQVLSQLVTGVPTVNYKVSNSGDALTLLVGGFVYNA